jgi:hypothetical protein
MIQEWESFIVNLGRANDWGDIVANMNNFNALMEATRRVVGSKDDQTVIAKQYKDIVDFISWWLTDKEFQDLNILNDGQVQEYDSHVKQAQSWFPRGSITAPLAPLANPISADIMEAERFVTQAKEQDSFDRAFPLVAAATRKLNKANDAIAISKVSREHRKVFTEKMNSIARKGDMVLAKKRDEDLRNNPSGFDADEATDRITRLSRTMFSGGGRRRHHNHHHHSALQLQQQQRHLLRLINLYAKQ